MNYQKIYDALIQKRKQNPLTEQEPGEIHHILMKSIYPELAREKTNLVKLSYREHFIAHVLLCKIYSGTENEASALFAWQRMVNCHKDRKYKVIKTSRLFALVRSEACKVRREKLTGLIVLNDGTNQIRVRPDKVDKFLKLGFKQGGLPMPKTIAQKISKALTGKKKSLTTTQRDQLRQQAVKNFSGKTPWNKGKTLRPLTAAEREIKRQKAVGKRHYTNGVKNIFVYPGTEPTGFYLGQKNSKSQSPKTPEQIQKQRRKIQGRRFITDGTQTRLAKRDEKLPDGWKYGRTNRKRSAAARLAQSKRMKGKSPNNKGKPRSAQANLKCSKTNIGKIHCTNGYENKFCHEKDIPVGWWKGQTNKTKPGPKSNPT